MKPVSGRGRVLLFTGAVLLPGAVLLAATVRLALQERALEAARREERITLLAASLAQELERRLQQVKDQALEALANPSAIADEHSALVLVAQVRAGHLVFPWDHHRPSQLRYADSAEHVRLLEAGEAAEFSRGQFAEAAALYRRATAAAGADSTRLGLAWLRQARALVRAGRREAARTPYRQVAALSPSVRDDDGMPLALYAAEGLLQDGVEEQEDARRAFAVLIQARASLGLTALSALRDLAARVDPAQEQAIARRIATVEQALEVDRDLPRLMALSRADTSGATAGRGFRSARIRRWSVWSGAARDVTPSWSRRPVWFSRRSRPKGVRWRAPPGASG